MIPKIKRWESKKYRDWVAKLQCGNCPIEDDTIVAHHLTSILAPHCGGTSLKASDYLIMPLCFECHNKMHATWDPELLQHQVTMIFNTLRLAFHHGIIGEKEMQEGGFWS
jgi:hypothetical protein